MTIVFLIDTFLSCCHGGELIMMFRGGDCRKSVIALPLSAKLRHLLWKNILAGRKNSAIQLIFAIAIKRRLILVEF